MPKKPTYRELEQKVRRLEKAAKKNGVQITDLKQKLKEELKKSRELESKLRKELKRYRFLYDFSPIALSEADSSQMNQFVNDLKKRGIKDFRTYFNDHPEAVAECARKLKVVDVNKTMVSMFKAKNKRELLQKFEMTVGEDSLESLKDGLVAFAEGKKYFERDVVVKTLDGKKRYVALRWSVPPGYEKSKARMLGARIDITDLVWAKEEMRKFMTITDMSNVGHALSDKDGNFVYVNEAFARMQGYEVEEVLGKHFSLFHTEEQMKNYFDATRDTFFAEGHVTNVEMWHLRKDGTVFPTLMNATVIRKEGSDELFVSTTAIDISDRHEMLKELEVKNRNLEEANIALNVVIKNGEKERADLEQKVIRNIQTLVKPYLEKLKKGGLDTHQQVSVDILESNLNHILAPFSEKLSSRFMNLTPTEVQVATLIKEGCSTKEAAELLHLAKKTIDSHRDNIRTKLGIKNQKINLRTYLTSL